MKDLIDTHEVMRFEVEGILIDGAKVFNIPTCKSQSYRAKRMIDGIDLLPLKKMGKWIRRKYILEDFIVLNQAIRILERD
jgi:hypothetical protein